MNKSQLRKKYKELRERLTQDEIEDQSLRIANQLLSLDIWDFTYYHLFLSIQDKKEIRTDYILHILQGKEKSVVLPAANFKTNEMTHFLLQDNTKLRVSSYGIPEPISGITVPPSQIEVVFVPLLSFDKKGNRIGYGKGFYDTFLSACNEDCIKIGLSFFAAETTIEANNHDVPLDYCVTPHRIYEF